MFCPRRLAVLGPSSSLPYLLTGTRGYAISTRSPKAWPGKVVDRVFDERKTYLYNHFTNVLTRISSEPLLFIQHKNFRVTGMTKLRHAITAAVLPKGTQFSLLPDAPRPEELPQFSVVRSSVFGVALRNYAPLDADTVMQIANMAGKRGGGGSLAVLRLPVLDPPALKAILRALERSVPKKKQADDASKGMTDREGRVPGRKMKRQRPILNPELIVLGAMIEGQVFSVEKVQDIANLPSLDTIHAQIVGLLSSPAVQLAAVLSEAGGGRVARTLEGLKKGLEEQSTNTQAEASP